MSGLSGEDRRRIDEARKLARLPYTDIQAYTGDEDLGMAYAVGFGRAQWALNDLLRLIDRLTAADEDQAAEDQAAEDVERMARIRGVLAKFDWEHDDRQFALEAIERIVEGGQA